MREYFPLIVIGAIIGVLSVIFIVAYALIKDKKHAIGFDRNMKDKDLIKRLLKYAKPYVLNFLSVLFLMIFSISYDVIAPLMVGYIEGMIKEDFELNKLFILVGVYASILVVSLISTYFQAVILQKTGQKIISKIREDVFIHIEKLSHQQLNHIPTGTLVTRTANDTNALSHMFTNLLVNLVKNIFVVFGVLTAMICLNYMLTLMVLCFIPFVVLFTIIFRKFSRKAYRGVREKITDINIYLSENLSGIKIIQIFNREERKKAEFDLKNQSLGKAKRRQMFTFGIFRPLVYMLYISSVLALSYLGGRGYINNVEFLGQS
ncbi:MAG: ABC transporter ATP-binding protein, partial [Clostridia bacterium]|nr:ABC transporter ATP-binding protein [Clostridia bacterium]